MREREATRVCPRCGRYTSLSRIQRALHQLTMAGWTWAAVADALGVRIGQINRWWAGTTRPVYAAWMLQRLEALATEQPPPKRRYAPGARAGIGRRKNAG